MPTVLIDADGCPEVNLTIRLCKGHGVAALILCDTAHRIERESAETLVFDKGTDSVDFALVNRVSPRGHRGDPGLWPGIHGWQNQKLLRAGKNPKGLAKRTREQDEAFTEMFEKLLITRNESIGHKQHYYQYIVCFLCNI